MAALKRFRRRRPQVHTAGAFAAGIIAADALHGPERADADGAARIQPAVSVVCWTVGQRAGLAPDSIHEEPGPAAGRGSGGRVLLHRGPSGAAEAAAERRPLHRRWHADRSVGRPEELPDEERRQDAEAAATAGSRR